METPKIKKGDSASETSVYEKASTSIVSSTSKVTKNDNFKHSSEKLLLPSQEDQNTSLRGQNSSDNYCSIPTSSCSAELSPSQIETIATSNKTAGDFTISPLFSLKQSSSSATEQLGMTLTANVEHLGSTETIEIILKQSNKKNVAPMIQHQSSAASIQTMDDAHATAIYHLKEGKQFEAPEIADKALFAIEDSMYSIVFNPLEDNSEIKIQRKSDSSVDARTVRFSLQDTEHPEIKDDKEPKSHILKASKSEHVERRKDESSEDTDSIESTNLDLGHVFVYMAVPPDGGYGWFICLISFLCQVVIDGVVYSIGILLPHIATDFNRAGSEVILIASLQIGFYFLFGTLASAFINKYGFRPIAFTGAVLSITFLTVATFSINLPMMILFQSILGGPALSLVWVSSQLVTGYYFDRYRPIANGAACSGAGVGVMLFSIMNSVLVPELGWRNVMRIQVLFLVSVLLMTLSYVEVAPTRIGRVKEPLAEDTESESLDIFYGLTNYSRFSIKVNNQEYSLDNEFEAIVETPAVSDKTRPACCTSCLQKCCPSIERFLERQREKKTTKEASKRYVIRQDPIEKHDLFYAGPRSDETENLNVTELLQSRLSFNTGKDLDGSRWHVVSLEETNDTFKRNTIIRNLSSRKVAPDQEPKPYRLTYAELKIKEKRPILAFLSPRNWLHPKIQKAFRLLFDFQLLGLMEFRLLLLSAFLFPMGFNIPFVYSTVRAQIDASLAQLITPTIGFSNFACRIASGFVAFKFRDYTTYICGGGMFFGGLAVFVSAFYGLDVVWFQFLYALCYGMAPAFYSTLRTIIYVRALGLDKLTNAFGLTALAMGLGVFIGTTAGGILNDLSGSYTASFVFAGFCICTAGALKLLLPYFIQVSKDKERK